MKIFIITIAVAWVPFMACAQGLIAELSPQIGIPEAFHARFALCDRNVRFGAGIGFVPDRTTNIINFSGNLFFHLMGKSEYLQRRPGYLSISVLGTKEENERKVWRYGIMSFRVGRDFNISELFGFFLEGGIGFFIWEKETYKVTPNAVYTFFSGLDVTPDVFPSVAIGVNIRFNRSHKEEKTSIQ